MGGRRVFINLRTNALKKSKKLATVTKQDSTHILVSTHKNNVGFFLFPKIEKIEKIFSPYFIIQSYTATILIL